MNILYIGELYYGSTCLMRMNALMSLGNNVNGINVSDSRTGLIKLLDRINFRLSYRFDFIKLNERILIEISKSNYDVIWIDKGKRIFPITLEKIKKIQPDIKIIHLNPDDPFGKFRTGWKTFIKSIPYYDIHFVAREVNISEYLQQGAKKIFVYDRSFDPGIHKPIELIEEEKRKYLCKVGFIGSWAEEREKSIAFLIENGVEVTIWGNGWQKGKYWNTIKKFYKGSGLNGLEYSKAINGMEIALHFLRRENRDEQDSRTFEIPACGSFLLAERSKKHEEFFIDGKEAVFFDDNEELLNKIDFILKNPIERKRIANNGYLRSVNSGYSHAERLKEIIKIIKNN